jgi:penicillin-binding protein 1C
MTDVARSPGSTLKPLIYGLAFEEGVVAPETIIDDRPTDFAGYRPENFDAGYRGAVSVREALQLSLNVPAVKLLDRVGPTRLIARLRRAGTAPALPDETAPGLATGLGGIGLSLTDLVGLYVAVGNRGRPVALTDGIGDAGRAPRAPVLQPHAAWHVADILSGVAPPADAPDVGLAYKTGTSYGYRDAWAVGFDGRHVIGVWLGRADNAPVPAMTGATAAAPALFDAYVRSGIARTPLPQAPAGAVRIARSDLPVPLRRFDRRPVTAGIAAAEAAPAIVYPPDGARVDLIAANGAAQPLVLKVHGGRAPFRWLANGRPLPDRARRRVHAWQPDGHGASTLTVIDAGGRAATVSVFVE